MCVDEFSSSSVTLLLKVDRLGWFKSVIEDLVSVNGSNIASELRRGSWG